MYESNNHFCSRILLHTAIQSMTKCITLKNQINTSLKRPSLSCNNCKQTHIIFFLYLVSLIFFFVVPLRCIDDDFCGSFNFYSEQISHRRGHWVTKQQAKEHNTKITFGTHNRKWLLYMLCNVRNDINIDYTSPPQSDPTRSKRNGNNNIWNRMIRVAWLWVMLN